MLNWYKTTALQFFIIDKSSDGYFVRQAIEHNFLRSLFVQYENVKELNYFSQKRRTFLRERNKFFLSEFLTVPTKSYLEEYSIAQVSSTKGPIF